MILNREQVNILKTNILGDTTPFDVLCETLEHVWAEVDRLNDDICKKTMSIDLLATANDRLKQDKARLIETIKGLLDYEDVHNNLQTGGRVDDGMDKCKR